MSRFVYKAVFSSKSSLSHHGIKNQKWGVRRYQNPDGSLTPEGRKRYGVGEKDASTKFKTSDVYAMEGAKRGGLLGAAVGKTIGVYKEKKEVKEQKKVDKFFKDVDDIERNSSYNFSVNDRKKPLDQNVKDTRKQLEDISSVNKSKLESAISSSYGSAGFHPDDIPSANSRFARQLALRINERFDSDQILDQHMDDWVYYYKSGKMSKSDFKKHYESEINDYAAWVLDSYDEAELSSVAKTFVDGGNDTSPEDSYKAYLKRATWR